MKNTLEGVLVEHKEAQLTKKWKMCFTGSSLLQATFQVTIVTQNAVKFGFVLPRQEPIAQCLVYDMLRPFVKDFRKKIYNVILVPQNSEKNHRINFVDFEGPRR